MIRKELLLACLSLVLFSLTSFLIINFFIKNIPFIPTFIRINNSQLKTKTITSQQRTYKVTRVIDGDTIEIEGGKKVRYIGIDTPETVDPRKPVECFGKEASEKNKELVEGKYVRLEKDISETDKYGRLLRYVYLDDIFLNLELVKQGFAYSSTFPPDIKYQQIFLTAERLARNKNLGLWNSCQ